MFKFFLKIILPAFLAVMLFVITLFFIVIPVFEQAMMDRKREMIKELTNSASSILEKYHKDEREGILTTEEAQQTAISRIKYLRYGDENKDYFWITDMHPVMIMHPYVPELNGTDLTDYEDSHGNKMFVDFVNVVEEEGQGYVEYMWQWKDDATLIVPKLSYVKKFEPWGWIIGTGIYIEDVKRDISTLTYRLFLITIVISVVVASILTFVSIQSLKIERKRQQAESSLKESKEKYRSLVEASTEGLLMLSDNKIIFSNAVFLSMVDITFEELVNMDWKSLFSVPEDLSAKIKANEHDFETQTFETKITLPDKEFSEVFVNVTPISFYGKEAIIFSIKDISSDVMMQQELLESRERFKSLMDKLNVGIFRTTVDSRGRFIEGNDTAINLLGFADHSQLKEKYILDFFVEKDDKRNFRKKLLETGFIKNQVIKLTKADGSKIKLIVSLAVVKNDEGEPIYCDGIVEPFTARQHEQSQHKFVSTDQFRTLLHTINVSTFIKPIFKIKHNQSIQEAARLMEDIADRHVFVVDDQNLILGYISDSEISSGLVNSGLISIESPVYNIMKSPVMNVLKNTSIIKARSLMNKTGTSLLVVHDANKNPLGYFSKNDCNTFNDVRLCEIMDGFGEANTLERLKKLREELVSLIASLVENKITPTIILQILSDAFDAIAARLFVLAFQELGEPPVEFAFIVLGSEGRNEQTLKTDQDNAIIYRDGQENAEETAQYFQSLGTWISEALATTGYSLCKGEIMAMNPKWNKPLSVWKQYFHKWINKGHGKDLLDISVFFDFRLCHGQSEILNELQEFIGDESNKNSAYLHQMAKIARGFKPTVSLFGNIVVESAGEHPDSLNIKASIASVVNFARIYSLQHGILYKNTLLRLKQLNTLGFLNNSDFEEIQRAFEYLTSIRLMHQAEMIAAGKKPDNYINIKTLSEFEHTILKKALSTIENMVKTLDNDFKLNI